MTRQNGFTLIELMVVVALVGVLAAIVVPSFFKEAAKARGDAEVAPMLAELASRIEGSKLQNGVYSDTEADGWYPAAISVHGAAFGTPPASWQALRVAISPDKIVRCTYISEAGGPTDTPDQAIAGDFGFTGSPINWYYVAAVCDLDNDTTVNSQAFQSSVDSRLQWQNRGK